MVVVTLHKFEPPRPDDWETDDLHIEELQQLAVAIDRDMPDERMDARAIARFQTGLIQFMESALGPNSMPPRPFPKLPFSWIDDCKPNGTLRDIIMKCHQLKEGKGLKSLEWRDLQQRMALLDILSIVRSNFEKNGFPVTPTVYFDKSVPEADVTELSGFVVKMKGKVVTDRNAVGLTHIVYPFGPNGDPDDGQEYMRTQRKRGTKALVHRWYTPDSHNEWVDLSVAPEQVENDAEHLLNGPAKVYVRWVKDSRLYNEWMNIVDYETDEGNEDHEKYKKELEQRGFTPAQFLERKRKARQAGGANKTQMFEAEQEVDPNFREEIVEGVVRRHVRFTNKRIKEGLAQSENISWGQMEKVYDGADAAAAMAHVGLPRQMTPLQEPSTDAHVRMPVYAHWFRMAAIHEIERNANVEFFNGRSSIQTPEKYMEYRNFMVERYRKCPQDRLTFMDCRRHLVGDVNAIHRIWTFLDSWGLINFEADPVAVLDEPMEVLTVDESGAKPQQVKTIRPGQATMRAPTRQAILNLPVVTPEKAVLLATTTNDGDHSLQRIGPDTSLLNKRDPTSKATGKEESTGGKQQFFCNAMPWVDCTACRYHCIRLPDIDLCPQAFAEGRFPPGTCSKDFIKIDSKSSKGKSVGWSDQEHLQLLEAIEMYGENFDKVAEYVGTKNRLDCVMQFLQMPIDEECVSNLRHSTVSRGAMCINPSAAVAKRDFPFSREENPLASQLIFLAEVVGAKIAAGAASAAMQELFEKGSVVHQELLYSAAQSAGIQVPKPQQATPEAAAPSSAPGTAPASRAASPAGQNGAEPMQVDAPAQVNGAANGSNIQTNENVVQDIAASIPPERLHAASAAAFLGAATKAKLLAEAEGMLLSGHAMTVLECMTQKMVVKNKYLNDIENEISSVHSKLVETRAAVLKTRDSISEKKKLLKKEKELLSAIEKRQKAEMGTDARSSGGSSAKKPAEGEISDGAAKKVPKSSDHQTSVGADDGAQKAAAAAGLISGAADTPAAVATGATSAAGAAAPAGPPPSTNGATAGASSATGDASAGAATAGGSSTPATGVVAAAKAPVPGAAPATAATEPAAGAPSVGAAPTPASDNPNTLPSQATPSSQDGANHAAAKHTPVDQLSKQPASEDGPQPMDTDEPTQ